ncbi:MAG: chitobiase/beta-hexosaminidase C-terminal domain-containing protein [Bacteroidota bacterium]
MTLFCLDIGHFHPLVVHMPIGILYFAGLLHLLGRWQRTNTYHSGLVVALLASVAGCAVSILSGWLLAQGGGYAEVTLFRHRWLGISTGVVALGLLAMSLRKPVSQNLMSAVFVVALGLLTLTGHLGGEMTHGKNFLFPPEVEVVQVNEVEEALLYSQVVAPILTAKCVACHSDTKQRGGLNMSSLVALRTGGDSGPVLGTEQSELLTRIHLPESDELHMPPQGKTQLTEAEVALIAWWLSQEACGECRVNELAQLEEMLPILQAHLDPTGGVEPATEAQLQALRAHGIDISSVSESDPLLGLSIDTDQPLGSRTLDALEEVATKVSYLSLNGVPISEDLMEVVAEMSLLEQFLAPNSSLSDENLIYLRDLPKLRVINAYGTQITDAGLAQIADQSSVERLYAWGSQVTRQGITGLQAQRPQLDINFGLTTEQIGETQLNPPNILATRQIFRDSATVTLASDFRNSTVRYTTDGSMPDSTSPVYSEPLRVDVTTRISAIAEKKGWETSIPATQLLLKAGLTYTEVAVSPEPNPTYSAQGAPSLVDLARSQEGFRSGAWLGYQGEHFETTLTLAEPQALSAVYVSALSEPNSWIYYPQGIEISVSTDGQNYTSAGSITLQHQEPLGSEAKDCFVLHFPTTEARYVKVAVLNRLTNPADHPAAGEPSWLFVDEILVE